MREILFRGKRVDGHGWVEGGIVLRANGQTFIEPIIDVSQVIIYAVDPDTVGQYTGLKDRNGKRIFEGDVLNNYWDGADEVPYLCLWQDNGWKLKQYDIDDTDDLDAPFCEDARVVGNVHDNPELTEA